MVRKVTLDTLDLEETPAPLRGREAETAEAADAPSIRWYTRRWFFWPFLSGIIILVCAAGLHFWPKGATRPMPSLQTGRKIPAAPGPAQGVMATLNEFLIPVTDNQGNVKAVACDLTVELNDYRFRELLKSNLVEARYIIFSVTTKKKATALMQREGRDGLKEEIGAELGKLMGKDVVKRVYFTKFVVL